MRSQPAWSASATGSASVKSASKSSRHPSGCSRALRDHGDSSVRQWQWPDRKTVVLRGAASSRLSGGPAVPVLYCFDRYYARDKSMYLAALRSVREQTLNMGHWLEYFLEGLAEEYERVQAEVEQLNRLGLSSSAPVQLKMSQQRGVSELAVQGVRDFTRGDYEKAAGVQRTAALADLDDLVKKRIIRRLRRGSGTAYAFSRASDDRCGRPRSWTPERIQAELDAFCAGRSEWPSVNEFRAARAKRRCISRLPAMGASNTGLTASASPPVRRSVSVSRPAAAGHDDRFRSSARAKTPATASSTAAGPSKRQTRRWAPPLASGWAGTSPGCSADAATRNAGPLEPSRRAVQGGPEPGTKARRFVPL